jgi:hypothetical protein
MAKMDYNSINFKNKDIDKFSTKFGKEKTDPEKEKARKANQTAGMTQNEINLYNQKGKLGQKHFAKVTAKKHLADEQNKNAPVVVEEKPMTPQEREALKVSKNSRRTNMLNAVGNVITPVVEAGIEGYKARQERMTPQP